MAEPVTKRLKHAWNAFRNRDPTENEFKEIGYATSTRQDRTRLRVTNERSIIISVYNRIALDVSAVSVKHVRLDENGMFEENIASGMNYLNP